MKATDLLARQPGFLTKDEVSANGEIVLTIKDVKTEEGFDNKEQDVLYFSDSRKKLGLNGTRVRQLADLFGNTDIIGNKIKLVVDVETVRGRNHEMICIREA